MKLNIAERVHRYIDSGLHSGVCDSCVSKAVRAHLTQVGLICTALATTREFNRDRDWCDMCGKRRKVTKRVY